MLTVFGLRIVDFTSIERFNLNHLSRPTVERQTVQLYGFIFFIKRARFGQTLAYGIDVSLRGDHVDCALC